jgi:8-oxo-dGTP diphosphatase
MCTPSVAIDIVLYSKSPNEDDYSVWVVKRGDTGQLATIGGFVEVGETTEHAVVREVEEETGIIIPPEIANTVMSLIGVYSDPRRDNRRHIVSVAYALEFKSNIMKTKDDSGIPKAGDDAKAVVSVPLDDIGVKYIGDDWFDDHLTILLDFKERISKKRYEMEMVNRKGELYSNVVRSTCASI